MRRNGGAAPPGDALLAERARVAIVAQIVCLNAPALLALTLVPLVVAILAGVYSLAAALAPGVAIATAMTIYGQRVSIGEPRKTEALTSVAASFIMGVLITTPGFVALDMSPVDALFEAASGVTTTGLSVANELEEWPFAAHFFRIWLQWIGGFAFVAAALALVVGQGVVARRLGAAGVIADDAASSAGTRARRLLAAYVALTVVSVIVTAALHDEPEYGALIALAAVSTAGFSPYADSVGGTSIAVQIATISSCLAGAIALSLWCRLRERGVRAFLKDGELRLFAGTVAASALTIVIIEWANGGASPWAAIFTAFSAHSTAGFGITPVDQLAPASLVVLIAVMAVGGCLGSTAGGIKAFRLAFFMASVRLSLLRARSPSSAQSYLRVFGRKTEPNEGVDIIGLIVLYAISALVVWFALVATGSPALPSLFDTISALSTVGLSAGAITIDSPDFIKLLFVGAMLLGRLEFLALFVFLAPRTWLKG